MQPASQLSPLEKTLGNHDSFEVDIGSLVLHVHKLVILSSPLTRIVRLMDKIRRWEASGLSAFLLITTNVSLLLPTCYYLSFVLGLLLMMGGLGVAHRRSQCLKKVFPPVHIKHEDLNRLDGPLSHEEMVQYYKAMLFKVDSIVQTCNRLLTEFYAVLKFENLQISIRWYTSLVIMVVSIHLLPLRWTVVMATNIFLLEGKIAQAITERRQELQKREVLKSIDSSEDIISQTSLESIGSTSDLRVMTPSDSDSEISEKGEELSSSEQSDVEEPILAAKTETNEASNGDNTSLSSKKSSKSSSMVGKLLEFKKKHQHAHTGNCMGCNVAFSSILKRRHVCLHCGNHFCSRCCSWKVSRAVLGATAPSAQTETVPVCTFCYMYLTGSKDKPS